MGSDESAIRSVDAQIYRCAVAEPFGYAGGFIDARESAVARVVTHDGTVGWGEAYAPGAVTAAAAAIATLGQQIVGRSVFERFEMASLRSCSMAPAGAAAASALALALLDACGKLRGKPVWSLLGAAPAAALRSYASALWFRRGDDPTAHYGEAVRVARECGFPAVKAKVGLGREDDLRAIARLREAGDGVGLMIDANQAYDLEVAWEVESAAAEAGMLWFEEPLPPDRLDDYAVLRANARVAIAAGETAASVADAQRWLAAPAVDIIQPDLCLVGGLLAGVEIAAMARHAGVIVAPHCYGLGIGLAASLHWAAVLGGAHDAAPIWIEVDTSPHAARDVLLGACDWFRAEGSELAVPQEPGLGIDLRHIARFRVG